MECPFAHVSLRLYATDPTDPDDDDLHVAINFTHAPKVTNTGCHTHTHTHTRTLLWVVSGWHEANRGLCVPPSLPPSLPASLPILCAAVAQRH